MATSSTAPLIPKVETKTLKLDELNVDESYQREPKTWLVQDIYNNFDRRAFGLITVSERADGTKWIVDGLQRSTAASWMDWQEIEAEIFHGLTREQEADLRLKKNRRQNETATERFKAKLAMKDKAAMEIVKICRQYDLYIAINVPENLRRKAVNSIVVFERLYAIDKGQELRRILYLLKQTFGDVTADKLTSNMLWMLHWLFLQHEGAFDEKRLTSKLQLGFMSLKKRGRMYAAEFGGPVWLYMYRILIEDYNEGLAKSRQLELVMRGARGVRGGPAGSSGD